MRRLQKTIFEIGWSRTVPRLTEADKVAQAVALMRSEPHDCVLVLREEKLVGIFTSRDFLNRVVAEKRDPTAVTLGEVMTREPRTLQAHDQVVFAINWMAIEGFRNVPIVDDVGFPLGVLTVFDVMAALTALFDALDENPRENLREYSSVSKVFDVGGGS